MSVPHHERLATTFPPNVGRFMGSKQLYEYLASCKVHHSIHDNPIAFSYSDYLPKWTAFAIYWIGLSLREYNENFSSNLIPHCMDFRPEFYENAYRTFRSYVENFPLTSPNHFSRPVKQIYLELLSKNVSQSQGD